jgi:hypothetical protein
MAIYVDDCLTIGTDEAINEVIDSLKGHLFLTWMLQRSMVST